MTFSRSSPFGLAIAPSDSARPTRTAPALLEELGGEVADVAQALDHHPLALDARREPQRLHVLGDAAHLARAEEDARGRSPRSGRGCRPALTGLAVTQPSASSSPGRSWV